MSDAIELLGWMRARGPRDITMRAIGDAGPRTTRRRAAADPAIAALIEAGAIVEVMARPRTFRVVDAEAAPGTSAASSPGLPSPEAIVVLLADEMADRRQSVPEAAAAYIASADVRSALMAQVREARGLPCSCEVCEAIGREVDDAMMSALGCDVGS